MTTATLRIPVRSALVQHNPYPTHGVEVLASIRLDLLADALRSMEHDDTDPGERPMNADQCRDALLRELLGGWSWSELVLARIPAIVEMQDGYSEIRRRLIKADDELAKLRPLEMLAARVDAPILDQAIEKIRAQADEIATLRRERDEAKRDIAVSKEIIQDLLDRMLLLPPDRNCSCHISPPCNDCVEYAGIRETIEQATEFITTPTPGAQA